MSKKRIGAIIILALIALLYIITLILSLIDSPLAKSCLMAALFCTIVLPAVAYGFMIITGYIKDRNKLEDEE